MRENFPIPYSLVTTKFFRIEIIDLFFLASILNPIKISLRDLSSRWNMSKDAARRLLSQAEKHGLLRAESETGLTKITMHGYSVIRDMRDTSETDMSVANSSTPQSRDASETDTPSITKLSYCEKLSNGGKSETLVGEVQDDVETTSLKPAKKERKESTKEKKERKIYNTTIPSAKDRRGEAPQTEDPAKEPLPQKLQDYFLAQGKLEFGVNVFLTEAEHEKLLKNFGEDLVDFFLSQMSKWSASHYVGKNGPGWRSYRLHTSHYETILHHAPSWTERFSSHRRVQ